MITHLAALIAGVAIGACIMAFVNFNRIGGDE